MLASYPAHTLNHKPRWTGIPSDSISSEFALDNQVRERGHEITEVDAKLQAAEANLRLTRERLGMSDDLLKEGLTS